MFDAWCRPRLLFQYLPYIQQEAIQLAEPDIQAVLEANFGAQGLEGQWGVCLASPVIFAQSQCKQHLNGILCYCVHHSTKHDSTHGTPAATAVSSTASANICVAAVMQCLSTPSRQSFPECSCLLCVHGAQAAAYHAHTPKKRQAESTAYIASYAHTGM